MPVATQTVPFEKRMTKAKVGLLLDQPFFGTLAARLPNRECDERPTACTNGKEIRWNPAFAASLSDAELKGVLAHEIMHVAMGHCWRKGSREHFAWNIACDYAINGILKDAGLTLPPGSLFPNAAQKGKSAEALYEAPTGRGGGGGYPGAFGEVEDAPKADCTQLEGDWKVAIAQAAAAARAAGKLPGDLARLVSEIVDPKVPWTTILQDFVQRTARNDYNWSRPNPRHLGRGIVLPSLISDELPAVVVAVDTSGSIGGKEMEQFAAEISAILGAYDTTIHVIYADAEVAGTATLGRSDLPLRLEPKGGGGTDFRPAFEWVEKEGIEPAAFIYLTDLQGTAPNAPPDYPVLWVCTTDQQGPWGQTVRMVLD